MARAVRDRHKARAKSVDCAQVCINIVLSATAPRLTSCHPSTHTIKPTRCTCSCCPCIDLPSSIPDPMRFPASSRVLVSFLCCYAISFSFVSCRKAPQAATSVARAESAPTAPFDSDNNGLYDDAERKVLLDEFLRVSPELTGIIKENSAPVYKAKSKNSLIFDENTDVPAGSATQADSGALNFDADGDGKVTILEMNKGHEPLSILMPPSFLASGVKIPWGIDIFPEGCRRLISRRMSRSAQWRNSPRAGISL